MSVEDTAEKHWAFLERWLHMVYVDAFLHGFKHGVDSACDAMCEAQEQDNRFNSSDVRGER